MILRRNLIGAIGMAALFALSPAPAYAEQTQPFEVWLKSFQLEASRAGIPDPALSLALGSVAAIPRVLELDRKQPEFMLTLWRYLEIYVPDTRIEKGKELLKTHQKLLAEVEKKYGVPPRFLVAFWGVETDFGRNFGAFHMLSAVATLAYDARRADFFKAQLLSAIKLVARGDVPVETKSSWAGAMGQSQFMPSSFIAYAEDGDGDGKKDIWTNQADVFASIANYLKQQGWDKSKTWGREVILPAGFDATNAIARGSLKRSEWLERWALSERSLADWNALGVTRLNKTALPQRDISAALVLPDGEGGRAFLAYDNYKVLMHWNRSYYFVTSVGYLADLIIAPE